MDFDFGANETVDDPMLVPEQFRSFYTEKDGAYVIDDRVKPLTTLVGGLAKSLKAARAEAKAAKGTQIDLSPLSEFGATPEEISTRVRTKLTDLESQLAAKGQLDPEKVKAELRKGFDAEIEAQRTVNKKMANSLERYLVDAAATASIAQEKGVPELLLPHIRSQVKVVEVNGDYHAVVVDKDGDARISQATGQPMTIADLVKEMKGSPTFGRAFESDAPSGSGMRPGSTSPTVPPQPRRVGPDVSKLSSVDKIKLGFEQQRSQRR